MYDTSPFSMTFRIGVGIAIFLIVLAANFPGSAPAVSSLETVSGKVVRCDYRDEGRYGEKYSKIVLQDHKSFYEVFGREFYDTCRRLNDERPHVAIAFHDVGRERYPFGPVSSSVTWPAVDVWDLRTDTEQILTYAELRVKNFMGKLFLTLLVLAVLLGFGWYVYEESSSPGYS